MRFWPSLAFIGLGAALGLAVLVGLRALYYDAMALAPEMHPGIALFLLPALWVATVIVAVPIEALSRRISFTPTKRSHAILVGISHSSLLTWWAFPLHWFAFVVINPIICRWLVGRLLVQPSPPADVSASRPRG